jgi:hypothetical protein
VNFDFQEQDIVPILRLFADDKRNIFIHPDERQGHNEVQGCPVDQAFDTL